MRDLKYTFDNVRMHAEAVITYNTPVGAEYADGTITITNYAQLIAAKAVASITYGAPVAGVQSTGDVTVVDYTLMSAVKATVQITILNYTQLSGETVTVNGNALVEGVDWNAAVSNDATATSLAAAIDGLASFDGVANSAVVTASVTAAGTAGNSATLTSTDEVHMTLSAAVFSGGRDATVITVNGTALTANVDFTAETDESTTATNLAAAIDALANVSAAAVGAVVTITADAHGTAGDAYTMATSYASAATVSGANFSGGVNGDTVIVNGTTLTCVDANAGAHQFTNITELESLTEAIAGIDSSQDGTTVSLVAATAGEAGNALTLALGGSNAGTMAISGELFTGGQDNASFTLDDATVVQGTDFTASVSNDSTATSLAAALDAATAAGAAAVGAVVTATASARGTAGNAIVFTQDVTGGSTISGAGTLSGGVAGDTITVDGHTYTCVVGSAGAGEFTSAATLASLIDAEAGISAANASGVITVKVDAVGAAGNSKTAAVGGSNAGDMEVTTDFDGGADALYTDPFDLPEDADSYEVTVRVTALTATCTADFTPQGSVDGGDNYDTAENSSESALSMTQFTGAAVDKQLVQIASPRNRLKLVLGGTSPYCTATVTFVSRND